MKFLKVLLTLLFYNNCFAGTIDPKVPDQKYLDYGKKFPFVAKVVGSDYASSVLINKNTFLTNAHVAKKISKVIVENNDETHEFEIIEIIVHKNYKKLGTHNNDIAIGRINGDFGLSFYPELNSEKNELGKTVSICGYGATGTFITGKNKKDRLKRAGSNIINETSKEFLYCSALDKPSTELEILICHGDSGGGLFIENKLSGLNCFIEHGDGTYNSNYSDKSGFIRISNQINWIKEHIK